MFGRVLAAIHRGLLRRDVFVALGELHPAASELGRAQVQSCGVVDDAQLEARRPTARRLYHPGILRESRLGLSSYYELKKRGLGPREKRIFTRVIITDEAAAEWRARQRQRRGDEMNTRFVGPALDGRCLGSADGEPRSSGPQRSTFGESRPGRGSSLIIIGTRNRRSNEANHPRSHGAAPLAPGR